MVPSLWGQSGKVLCGLTREKKVSFLLLIVDIYRLRQSCLMSDKTVPRSDCTHTHIHTHAQADKHTCFIGFVWMWPLSSECTCVPVRLHNRHKPLHQQPINWTGTMKTWRQPQCTSSLFTFAWFLLPYVQKLWPPPSPSLAMRQDALSFIPMTLPPAPWNLVGGLNFDLWRAAIQSGQTLPSAQSSWSCTVDLLSTC